MLAAGASDCTTKLCTVDSSSVRETSTLAGHTGPVERVKFHPCEEVLLCSTANDSSVKIWDTRSSSLRSIGHIHVPAATGSSALDIGWSTSASDTSLLAVTERNNGTITVYDTRKLSSSTNKGTSNANAVLKIFHSTTGLVESCIFSPAGRHLVGAMTTDGLAEIKGWEWAAEDASEKFVFPAHTGPIYCMTFSPDGNHLATGGADAVVGLWDVDTMVCTHTIDRCSKFIRSVAYSHDSSLIASSYDDDFIDLASAGSGELVAKVPLGRHKDGADEISFHPTMNVLACARCPITGPTPAVTVIKMNLESIG